MCVMVCSSHSGCRRHSHRDNSSYMQQPYSLPWEHRALAEGDSKRFQYKMGPGGGSVRGLRTHSTSTSQMCKTAAVSHSSTHPMPKVSLPLSPSQTWLQGHSMISLCFRATGLLPHFKFDLGLLLNFCNFRIPSSVLAESSISHPLLAQRETRTLPKMELLSTLSLLLLALQVGRGPSWLSVLFQTSALALTSSNVSCLPSASVCWTNRGSQVPEFGSCLIMVSSCLSLGRNNASCPQPLGPLTTVLHPSAAASKTQSSSMTHLSAISMQPHSYHYLQPHHLTLSQTVTAPSFHPYKQCHPLLPGQHLDSGKPNTVSVPHNQAAV